MDIFKEVLNIWKFSKPCSNSNCLILAKREKNESKVSCWQKRSPMQVILCQIHVFRGKKCNVSVQVTLSVSQVTSNTKHD